MEEFQDSAVRTLLSSTRPTLEIRVVLVLSGKLWESHRGSPPDIFSTREDVRRRHWDEHPANAIVYEGRFSSKPYTWNGLALEVVSPEERITFDEVVAEIVLKEREHPESMSEFWNEGWQASNNI